MILLSITAAACSTASSAPRASLLSTETAFVANHAISADPGSTITPVDLASGTTGRPIRTGTNLSTKAFSALDPSALTFGPHGKTLYVANLGSDTVSEVTAGRGTVAGSFEAGLEPDAVAIAPDGRMAWVADLGSGSILPVNLPSGRAGKAIGVGNEPRAVTVTPNGAEVLCANFGSSTVSILSTRTRRLVATVPVGLEPTAVAITSNSSQALVADLGANAVTVIDLSTNQVLRTVALAGDPTDIVAAAGVPGSRAGATVLYVTAGASITPITTPSDTPGPAINIVYPAEAVALSSTGTVADVALQGGAIVEVNLATGKLGHLIHVGGIPTAIAVPPPVTTP